MKLERFKISLFTNPSGTEVYRVDGKDEDGKRVRKNFGTIAEAKAEKQRLESEIENIPIVPVKATRLSESQIEQAEHAFSELSQKAFSLSLVESVKWAMENWTNPEKRRTMTKAFDEFIEAKRRANLRPATLRTLNQRVGRIAEAYPEKLVSDIQADALRALIFRDGSGIVNQESDYRAFTNFFNWAMRQSYCTANPMTKIEKIKIDRKEVEIIPLNRVRLLLNAAMTFKGGVCLPYVVLGMFCALRPEAELAPLTWDDIDLPSGTVRIKAAGTKVRSRRVADIPPNAIKLLSAHALKRTPIKGANWRKDFEAVKGMAGYGTGPELQPWPMDVMRHTGITHHLARHKNEGLTAEWAGTSPTVIHQSYRSLKVQPGETEAFWSIVPSDFSGKVLRMRAA
jgi:integrase